MERREWALIGASGVVLGLHFATWIVSVQLTTVAAASVLVTTSAAVDRRCSGLLGVGAAADAGGRSRRSAWASSGRR